MPIISVVGRRQKKVRALITALYVVLVLGAATMVYPFLLMVSTSFTSPVDQNEFRVIPRYFYDDGALYRKYIESKYNEDIVKYNIAMGTEYPTFADVPAPEEINERFVEEWRAFKAGLPSQYLMLGHATTLSKITPETVSRYRAFLRQRFDGDVNSLNASYKEASTTWMDVVMPIEDWAQRSFAPNLNAKYTDFQDFKRTRPDRFRITVSVDGLFQEYLRMSAGNIDAINKALGTEHKSRSEVRLEARLPDSPAADNWEAFVRRECPVRFVRLDESASPAYHRFVRRKYVNPENYNSIYETSIRAFDELSLPRDAPDSGIGLTDWMEFLENDAPVSSMELRTPEILFRAHLAGKHGGVEGVNREFGTKFASLREIVPPYCANDFLELRENRRAVRTEFIIRNYREVLEYIALHGRALVNTAILCIAMVATALIVNPLCAYALSRFNLRSTYKILLFLLATMAFPAEVSAIPSFLLIKDLNLLGTYWAIILPAMANGYSIFLLKGFFDSLPKELYEAAVLDGATEMQMYRNITLQLSKPVLAVIALGTFTAAYGSFMWAFLVLQDPKMWTLMVWLYQMQIWAPQFMVYAGLVLAALPTLIVFICCQNVIMRGIIVPSEK